MELLFCFSEQHFTEVVGSEEFLNLGMEQVSSLIASDKLTIPTEEKVHTLIPLTSLMGRCSYLLQCELSLSVFDCAGF